MEIEIRPARKSDIPQIASLINSFAAKNLMLPRTEEQIEQVLEDFVVAVEGEKIVGCASLVELDAGLVEIRSLAVSEEAQGKGLGSRLVDLLVERAREKDYDRVCALTLREKFFNRLGFKTVDRWELSPKVWQECIYCPKFHHCDEIAVVMDLKEQNEVMRRFRIDVSRYNGAPGETPGV